MSGIEHRADRMPCVCPPLASDNFLSIVSWTGWALALAAILVMIVAHVRLLRHMSGGTDCGDDPTSGRITGTLLICVLVAIAGSLVGAFGPH
ncbi:hypothetical protein DFR67_12648 [Williamsia limnetica]|uniref:Uncharacterized protein n=1 Tax=Williamsia limnetica TaxID=882452 RepID=A0A318RDR2_WILLI|nr:hypothetical protein [Williamsia limnetica]PYE12040.1 hypothetical protein DFR67_12648 [Williamsia limnetica]